VVSLTDDNDAEGNLDKRNMWLIGAGYTSGRQHKLWVHLWGSYAIIYRCSDDNLLIGEINGGITGPYGPRERIAVSIFGGYREGRKFHIVWG